MSEAITLLDTPKKLSLQTQSALLRAALKDFERTFASNNDGRKPSKEDIRSDADISVKYKQYNKVRDVLAGKLSYEACKTQPKSPTRRKKHERVDSGLSWSPEPKTHTASTPRKNIRQAEINPYDAPSSITPRPIFLNAIGPTPQRDGRVLGLFDMMSNSAKSSQATPSGSRKRKAIELVCESPQESRQSMVAQTPSQKRNGNGGDILQHLAGGYEATPETGHRRNGRTPVSEGRKFMLSQFFATPSGARYSNFGADQTHVQKTPLRDALLGLSPAQGKILEPALDATPAYLKRTTSFKDRLLSASSPASRENVGFTSPSAVVGGPPTLRHFRSVARLSSQATIEPRALSDHEDYDEYNDNDDDLEALRELEGTGGNVLVKDSQMPAYDSDGEQIPAQDINDTESQPTRIWKKKGQKRTTKRSKMKPGFPKLPDAPKFVVAEDPDEEREHDESQILETQLVDQDGEVNPDPDQERRGGDGSDFENQNASEEDTTKKVKKSTKSKEAKKNEKPDGKKKAGTINPNAQSHMNFRSLKIRNKNSKAKGAGRGRFGRR